MRVGTVVRTLQVAVGGPFLVFVVLAQRIEIVAIEATMVKLEYTLIDGCDGLHVVLTSGF